MNIGENIYELRKANKLTQEQLAAKLNVSEQAVSKWENGICAPDVSLFPRMAELFNVSIDRIFGFYRYSYEDDVKKIVKSADDSMDTYKEIEIISEGLQRYPNSPDLKLYLAFSLSMVNRISKDVGEKKDAVKKAIVLCNEVIDNCNDIKHIDRALDMLQMIYTETGEYDKALEVIGKLSSDSYNHIIVGRVDLLYNKGEYDKQLKEGQTNLFKCWMAMGRVLDSLSSSFMIKGEYQKATEYIRAHLKLLSVFDEGCPDFYATHKIWAQEKEAKCYMRIGDKMKCLEALKKVMRLTDDVRNVSKSPSFEISKRNPTYFSELIDSNALEEYMSDVFADKLLAQYDGFFGEDREYADFKNTVV